MLGVVMDREMSLWPAVTGAALGVQQSAQRLAEGMWTLRDTTFGVAVLLRLDEGRWDATPRETRHSGNRFHKGLGGAVHRMGACGSTLHGGCAPLHSMGGGAQPWCVQCTAWRCALEHAGLSACQNPGIHWQAVVLWHWQPLGCGFPLEQGGGKTRTLCFGRRHVGKRGKTCGTSSALEGGDL